MSVRYYHSLQTVKKTASDQSLICYLRQSVKLKDKCLTVLEYIFHPLPVTASCIWHLLEPVHLTLSLLQLLKGTDSLQQMIDW